MFSRILTLTFRVNRKWKINTLPDAISNEWGIKHFAWYLKKKKDCLPFAEYQYIFRIKTNMY